MPVQDDELRFSHRQAATTREDEPRDADVAGEVGAATPAPGVIA